MNYIELNICPFCNHVWMNSGLAGWKCSTCGRHLLAHVLEDDMHTWHTWYKGEDQGLLLVGREE